MKQFIFVCVLISFAVTCAAQNVTRCDSIYESVDAPVGYRGGARALRKFIMDTLVNPIYICNVGDTSQITTFTAILVIGANGKVIDAKVSGISSLSGNLDDNPSCKSGLIKSIMKMKGWLPAQRKGKPVCSYYKWQPIIDWQEE